ncbi:uncharacterized protein LOC103710724 isoform X2 [Phoenix dactylifera]|uniref:Uncharacterized protein LOC103710724 isoform X2 n=1 Tax=Phoenix dactylifera TaxID=42345 RepID=A0A8B8ZBM5_PHODC|nr:uncharacterized protein LOC103710724 isoform X2 [Phoenix dactylifera]
MLSFKSLTGLHIFSSKSKSPFISTSRSHTSSVSCSLGSRKTPVEHLRYESNSDFSSQNGEDFAVKKEFKEPTEEDGMRGGEEKRIPGIYVPRQKYISVSKGELLDAILSLFESKQDAEDFVRFSTCLDSILHAEHKGLLEEMRTYYSLMCSEEQKAGIRCSSIRLEEAINSKQHLASDSSNGTRNREENSSCKSDEKPLYFPNGLDPRSLFGSFHGTAATNSVLESRVAAVATQFQRSFMKLLCDAQFEELSVQDLLLTDALNNDYLLTLPIYVDWKKASESNAIIFSLKQVLKSLNEAQDMQLWIEKVKNWLKEQYLPESAGLHGENMSKNQFEYDQIADGDLPIWLAAQRAVSRYEGFLSPAGPRGRLIRRLLTWTGLIPSLPEASIDLDDDDKYLETYLRPNFLPRITLGNIWEPAMVESCGHNVWKRLKTAVSILFSRSTLQEPAFQELILLYTDQTSQTKSEDKAEILPLQLKIYQRIPLPDLPVIFPHKKLSFRILDTVRLDVATMLGLLAYFVNYKFENILSSPSAVFLDVIAVSTLIIYISRVVLGYKQTWDRYQLLVNRALYEKTLASGFGSVHFLLDASEQQQYKEAILVYALLLHPGKYQVSCRKSMKDACERFMYDKFKEKIEMPIDKAVNTLLRLELVTEFPLERSLQLEALPCSEACETLRKRWDGLLK